MLKRITPIQRAALSHWLRLRTDRGAEPPLLEASDALDEFLKKLRVPTPAEQASNIIRFIGDRVLETGEPRKELPVHFYASIGTRSPQLADALVENLVKRGLLSAEADKNANGNTKLLNSNLTLDGWERYEQVRHLYLRKAEVRRCQDPL